MVKVITTTTSMMLYLFTAITTCRTAFGFSTTTSRNGLLLSTTRTATKSRNGQAAFATMTSPFFHSNHRQNHGSNSNGLLSSFHRTTASSPTGKTSLFMSSSASSNKTKKSKANKDDSNNNKVPITLLSGFLGSGKTTTLEHILHNNDGMKIGIVVNDVASVNIDAKLVSNKGNNGVIELQNGCACCSLADELLTSVDQLLSTLVNSSSTRRIRKVMVMMDSTQ